MASITKGAWTIEEDKLLIECVNKHGPKHWPKIAKRAGLKRCGKSCRLRWLNYLRPNIKRGNFGSDEEDLIIKLHKLLGNRWSLIAGRLPGRTDNEVKNYWNSTLLKRMKNHIVTSNGHQKTKCRSESHPAAASSCENTSIVHINHAIKPAAATLSPSSISAENIDEYHNNDAVMTEFLDQDDLKCAIADSTVVRPAAIRPHANLFISSEPNFSIIKVEEDSDDQVVAPATASASIMEDRHTVLHYSKHENNNNVSSNDSSTSVGDIGDSTTVIDGSMQDFLLEIDAAANQTPLDSSFWTMLTDWNNGDDPLSLLNPAAADDSAH